MRALSQIPVSYLLQSYLDSALGATAILDQPTNQLIIPSTKRTAQGEGFAVGVAGFSDTPVAFQFVGSENDSGVMICRPGQVIRPGRFLAFEYGLPFGWLGGGRAVIYIAHTQSAEFDLGISRPELVFHRFRGHTEASADPLPPLIQNWPLYFPWSQATRGVAGGVADQRGNPIFRVEPTRTLLRLRSQIAVPTSIGIVFRGSREFDSDSAGVVSVGDFASTSVEVTFPASTDPAFAPYPTISIPEDFLRLACDEGGVTFTDLGAGFEVDLEIDVVRFGRI